jgi:RNA polymerase sigma-32 factor
MEETEHELEHNVDVGVDRQNYNVAVYVASAKKFPLLSREEEKTIAIKALSGDKNAGQKLVQSNLLLVVKIAHEYRSIFNNLNDLIQEGNVGLLRSVSKYDPDRGYRFSTYAGWWIRSMMLRYIFNNSHMIKPGTTNEQKKLFYNLRKEQRRLEDMGVDADAATIAANLDVSEEDVVEMDGRLRNDIYLDSPVAQGDEDDSGKTLSDCISSSIDEQPDMVVENNNFRSMLRAKLDTFAKKLKSDRHREIFYKRIVAEEPLTLQELGDSFGITKERTRQIEEEITGRLRKYLKNCISR